jgi:AAA domain
MSDFSAGDESIGLRPASQIVARPLAWLWPGHLPLGKLTIFDGDPGVGKSLVALDLCARLSRGQPFPDGSPSPGPCNSIVLGVEDKDDDTVNPRLQALGADLARVFVLDPVDRDGRLRCFPELLAVLDQALARTGAKLLVIDPIMAFLGPGIQSNSEQSLRQVLFALMQLAAKYQCVILLIRHLNKREGGRALYRGGGSIGFAGVCRSGWLIAGDPEHPDHFVLAKQKSNLGPPQPSLAFTVVALGDGLAIPNWLGPVRWTADQLVARKSPVPSSSFPRDRAREFLQDALEDGPVTVRELWPLAEAQGFSERTLRRAKGQLDIRTVRVWIDGGPVTYWKFDGQQLPDSVPPEAIPPDLEPWLAPLRAKYPPPTPLDDL